MELMRLLFGTKDPRPAVSERETWIILLSRKLKENENMEERLAVSILLNCILFSVQCNSNFCSMFPQFSKHSSGIQLLLRQRTFRLALNYSLTI